MLLRALVGSVAISAAHDAYALDCTFSPTIPLTSEVIERVNACRLEKERARLGTYFCYIEQMVGIQYNTKDNDIDFDTQPFTGRIRPQSDKFFVELRLNESAEFCRQSIAKGDAKYCDHLGAAPYISKTESNDIMHSGKSFDSYQYTSVAGTFWLFGNKRFRSFKSVGNSYIAEGKCEKIK